MEWIKRKFNRVRRERNLYHFTETRHGVKDLIIFTSKGIYCYYSNVSRILAEVFLLEKATAITPPLYLVSTLFWPFEHSFNSKPCSQQKTKPQVLT